MSWGPLAIAVDLKGNVFVADTYGRIIQKFDSSRNFLTEWGPRGSGDGEFSRPESIAVDSKGNLYVADTYNQRIQKFDSSGKFLTKRGSKGSGDGEFDGPRGIAVDSRGNVFVAEYGNHRIQKFDSSGKFLAKWGSEGSRDGELKWPDGIGVDSSGNVYVADAGNRRIQKFNTSGKFLTNWGRRGFILRCWITAALILVVLPLGLWALKRHAESTRKAKPLPEREEQSKAKEPSFWTNLPRIFIFPFRGAGPFVMFTGGVVLAGMDWLERCHQELVLRGKVGGMLGRSSILALFWIVVALFVLGYTCKYLLSVIRSSAAGCKEPPDFQEIEYGYRLSSLWRFFVPFMLSFGPFIIYLVYLGYLLDISFLRQVAAWDILGIGLLIAGGFYFPISLGAVAVLGTVRGAGPVPVMRSIVRSPIKYIVTWLVFTILSSGFFLRAGLRQFGLLLIEIPVLGAVVRPFGLLYLWAMHIPFLGDVFAWFLSLYFWIAAMHVLGVFYWTNQDRWDSLLRTRRRSTPVSA
jgi:sugar lactone lactonase YvrE